MTSAETERAMNLVQCALTNNIPGVLHWAWEIYDTVEGDGPKHRFAQILMGRRQAVLETR